MWWKIYYWIIFILTIVNSVLVIFGTANNSLHDWIDAVESVILTIGTYYFVFNKKILSTATWRVIFWYLIASTTLWIAYMGGLNLGPANILFFTSDRNVGLGTVIIAALLALPALYAIYKLSGSRK